MHKLKPNDVVMVVGNLNNDNIKLYDEDEVPHGINLGTLGLVVEDPYNENSNVQLVLFSKLGRSELMYNHELEFLSKL